MSATTDTELVSIERHVLETLEECARGGIRHSDAADAAWEALHPVPKDWRKERAKKIGGRGAVLCSACDGEPWSECDSCNARGIEAVR